MSAPFTLTERTTGTVVNAYAVRKTIINGVSTAEFLVFDTRVQEFKWFPASFFIDDAGGIAPTVRVQEVILDKFNATVDVGGDPVVFTATIIPEDAANKNVNWTISDSNYATITPSGLTCTVTPIRSGRATLTVTTEDNNISHTAQIYILTDEVYVNSIDFLPSSLTLEPEEYGTLTALTGPSNAANRVVTFSIVDGGDKIRISPISNNYITIQGLEIGQGHIRATAQDAGGFSQDFIVNVTGQTSAHPTTYAELVAAVSNEAIDTITLEAPITLQAPVTIARTILFDGNNQQIHYNGTPQDGLVFVGDNSIIRNVRMDFTGNPEEWQGIYGIQVYNSSGVRLSNITCEGDDGGILINGSSVQMAGTIDVSGNQFGGIEVSRGSTASQNSSLDITDCTLVNTTEAFGQPTIWVEKDQGVLIGGTLTEIAHENQLWYFIDPQNAVDPEEE